MYRQIDVPRCVVNRTLCSLLLTIEPRVELWTILCVQDPSSAPTVSAVRLRLAAQHCRLFHFRQR